MERVGAVVDQDVGIGAKAGVRDRDRVVVVVCDFVLITVIVEDRHVDLGVVAAGQDLADDVHLAGGDRARHHQLEQALADPGWISGIALREDML